MFESSIVTLLKADSTVVGYLSTYNGTAAIFSEDAPENAALPYIVFNISRDAVDHPAVQAFTIMINIFDDDKSRSDVRKLAERIEFLLDRTSLEHERYKNIRVLFFAGSPVEGSDPRTIHYNLQFTARAGRKKWIDDHNT